MKKYLWLWYVPVAILISCSADQGGDPEPITEPLTLSEQLEEAEWQTTAVSDAIAWKYHHFDDLFSSKQSVTIFDIHLNGEVSADIAYVTSGFLTTSEAGKQARAKVAINGSYFDTSKGGSTVFFRKDGTVINQTRTGFTSYRENAAFVIGRNGLISIVGKPNEGDWISVDEATVLAGGPHLIDDGILVPQLDNAFNTNRHPRTAIGLTKDNRLLAVVVDGRSSEAHGMSIAEIAEVMEALGCVDAMNLDGGGSSTAYVINRGVVNYPSDNQKFDHEGERGVATVIVFEE